MDLTSLGWVFERLEPWLNRVANHWTENSAREKAAFGLFLGTLNKTQIYLGRLEANPDHSDTQEEEALSAAWNEAALAVKDFDPDLYNRCLAKACYWSGSHYYQKTDLAKLNISIDTMIQIATAIEDKQ